MKRLLLTIILSLTVGWLIAQQDPQFSHNMFTNMAINPAYAGASEAICVTALVRQQWMGFEDPTGDKTNPKTMFFSLDGEIPAISSGLGLVIINDKIAFEDNTSVKLAYAFRMPLGPGRLGIGAQINFMQKSIDFSKYIPKDKDDPLLMSKNVQTDMLMDYAAGVYYNTPEFFAGISATQLSQAEFAAVADGAKPSLKRHYYIIGGYNYSYSPALVFKPSILIKTDFVSTQYDINARVHMNDLLYGGLSYRPQDALVALAGIEKGNWIFGVSYDITTSLMGSGKRSSGSVELFGKYCFKIVIPKYQQGHRTARYL